MADKEENKETEVVEDPVNEFGVPKSVTEAIAKAKAYMPEDSSEEEAPEEKPDESGDKEESDEESEESKEDDGEPSESEDEEEGAEETVEIDPRLVAAGKARGWSDEKIIKLAEEDEGILEALADAVELVKGKGQEPEEKPEPEPETKKDELSKVELDGEALASLKEQYGDEVVDKVISPLVEAINADREQLNILRGDVTSSKKIAVLQVQARNTNIANETFDEASKTFPVLGLTKDLTRSADGLFDEGSESFVERSKVFEIAYGFHGQGMPFDEAMKQALQWYAGGNTKALHRKITKELKNRTKKFSPRPTGKKTKKTFATREDEGVSIVKEAMSKSGLKTE